MGDRSMALLAQVFRSAAELQVKFLQVKMQAKGQRIAQKRNAQKRSARNTNARQRSGATQRSDEENGPVAAFKALMQEHGVLVFGLSLGVIAGLVTIVGRGGNDTDAQAQAPAYQEAASQIAIALPTQPKRAAPKNNIAQQGLNTQNNPTQKVTTTNTPVADVKLPALVRQTVNDRIRQGETLGIALTRHGVAMESVNRLVANVKGQLDVRSIRPGDHYKIEQLAFEGSQPKGSLRMDVFEFSPSGNLGAPMRVRAERQENGTYNVARHVAEVNTKVVALSGSVQNSLYVSMRGLGEGPDLVNRFVDVFAWDIDFYREPQKGDTWKVIVEKRYADGRFIGYGHVQAAEYINSGRVHRGFSFHSKDNKVQGIFDDTGNAMEKTFLKNPLEIARITSHYGQRFHPVLKRRRPHNGVDYGAARGTPYWAVADGVVEKAYYSRTAGNMIVLRHANGFETQYFHSSRFAKGIHAGAHVKQRQIIGYVGTTGRSTGPHLHFGMKRNGSYVNPSKQRFPAAKPVPRKYVDEYRTMISPLVAELEALEIS